MIVKRFGCTAIHNKALYKCIIHSFVHSKHLMLSGADQLQVTAGYIRYNYVCDE